MAQQESELFWKIDDMNSIPETYGKKQTDS